MMDFCIEQWRAWAPGLDTEAAWQAWAQCPVRVPDDGTQPACDFLAALQRRRLSRLARMTMHVAWPLCGEEEQLTFVFASRHGETPRTFALLSDVADGQPLSPTQFGLSVHNAIAGQWSILRKQHGESISIAGGADTFEHAMLEVAMLLGEGAPCVLVVMAEELPPTAYDGWIEDVPFSYAVALRVSRVVPSEAAQGGERWRLQRQPAQEGGKVAAWPHALAMVRALHLRASTLEHTSKTHRWIWQRIP